MSPKFHHTLPSSSKSELSKLRCSCTWKQVTILAAACSVATLHPKFRHSSLRPYRAAMYAGLGLSAIVFIIHGLTIHGWDIQNRRMSLSYMALMGTFNLVGAAIYAARVSILTSVFRATDLTKFRSQKDGTRNDMTYLAPAIRYFTSWSFLQGLPTCLGF